MRLVRRSGRCTTCARSGRAWGRAWSRRARRTSRVATIPAPAAAEKNTKSATAPEPGSGVGSWRVRRGLNPAFTQARFQHTPRIRLRRSKGVVPLGGSRAAAQGGSTLLHLAQQGQYPRAAALEVGVEQGARAGHAVVAGQRQRLRRHGVKPEVLLLQIE